MVPVDADFPGIVSLLTEVEAASRYGSIVQRPIPEGGVIERSALAEPASESGLRAMSLPVAVSRSAGGTILVGDRVDVITVVDGTAMFVAAGIEVLALSGAGAGFSSVDHHLVVAVNSDQALALASALSAGSLDVVRSTGAPNVQEGPPSRVPSDPELDPDDGNDGMPLGGFDGS